MQSLIKVIAVKGEGTIDEIFAALCRKLMQKHNGCHLQTEVFYTFSSELNDGF